MGKSTRTNSQSGNARKNSSDKSGSTATSNSAKPKDKESNYPCGKCLEQIGEAQSIQCDGCSSWIHFGCSLLSKDQYDFLRRSNEESIKWFCTSCVRSTSKSAFQSSGDKSMAMPIDDRLNMLTTIVQTLQDQNKMILTLLQNTGGNINSQIREEVKEFFENEKEKQIRKDNLIFFNIPESMEKSDEAIQIEDAKNIQNICESICPGINLTELRDLKVSRLGRIKPPTGSRPRGVKVKFGNEETKTLVLKNARNLKKLKQMEKVVIQPDKTLKEREQDKALVEEMKQRRLDSGEDLFIRNGKILSRNKTRMPDSGLPAIGSPTPSGVNLA